MKPQIFIGCEVNQHHKCSHEFTLSGETFTCNCSCHLTDFERLCVSTNEREIVHYARSAAKAGMVMPTPALIGSPERDAQFESFKAFLAN